ncbi:MAG: CBS domain-containing protein [Fimbriimonadia bacterium]|jgi:stage IV sporulation protein FB
MRYRLPGSLVEPTKRQREDAAWSVTVWDGRRVTIRLHFTLLLLFAWLGYHSLQGPDHAHGALFLLGVLASFLVHDLAHAAMALGRGYAVRDVVVYPLGGLPSFDRKVPPGDDALVFLMGPLANAVVAALLFWICELTGPVLPFDRLIETPGHWLEKLIFFNFTLALLNLYPGYPADGGRLLRAVLSSRLGQGRSAMIAAALGHGAGMMAGLYAALGHPYLLFFTVFMILGAGAELSLTHHRELVEGAAVEEAMITNFTTLSPADTLGHACEMLVRGSQQDFPVMHEGRLLGMLSRDDLLRGLGREGRLGYVAGAMRREFPHTTPSMDLSDLIDLFEDHGADVLPVLDGEHVVGIITPENVGEYLAVKRHSPRNPEQSRP